MQKEKELLRLAQEELEQKMSSSAERDKEKQSELDAYARSIQEREYEVIQRERAVREASRELDAKQNETSVQMEILQVKAQEVQKNPSAATMTDLVEKAKAERIRLSTSGSLTIPGYTPNSAEAAGTPTYNKGITLFKAALLTLFIVLSESLAVFFLHNPLNIPPWAAAIPFGIAFIFFAVCAILYACGYKPQVRRKKKPTYISNAFITFVIASIVVMMIAVLLRADLKNPIELCSYLLIPIIFLTNILLFTLFYHLFSKAKQPVPKKKS